MNREELIEKIAQKFTSNNLNDCSEANHRYYQRQASDILALMPFGEIRHLLSAKMWDDDPDFSRAQILALLPEQEPEPKAGFDARVGEPKYQKPEQLSGAPSVKNLNLADPLNIFDKLSPLESKANVRDVIRQLLLNMLVPNFDDEDVIYDEQAKVVKDKVDETLDRIMAAIQGGGGDE